MPNSMTAMMIADILNERSVNNSTTKMINTDTIVTMLKSVGVISLRSSTACDMPVK